MNLRLRGFHLRWTGDHRGVILAGGNNTVIRHRRIRCRLNHPLPKVLRRRELVVSTAACGPPEILLVRSRATCALAH